MANTIYVKMLQTQDGSEDGINISTFEEGKSYHMKAGLAGAFMREKWAEKSQIAKEKPLPKSNTKDTKSKKSKSQA